MGEETAAAGRVYPPRGLKVQPGPTTTNEENISTFSMTVTDQVAVRMECATRSNKEAADEDRVYRVVEVADGLEDVLPIGASFERSARLTKVSLIRIINGAMSGDEGWRPEGWVPPKPAEKPAETPDEAPASGDDESE